MSSDWDGKERRVITEIEARILERMAAVETNLLHVNSELKDIEKTLKAEDEAYNKLALAVDENVRFHGFMTKLGWAVFTAIMGGAAMIWSVIHGRGP